MEDYEKKYKDALAKAREIHRNEAEKRFDMEWLFPELKESEDERIRKTLIRFFKDQYSNETEMYDGSVTVGKAIIWLETLGEQPSAIRWYDVSLIPQEMEELLVEWDSEDATWHEIAFYHADTKTFWNGTRQMENVTRWCYVIDLLDKQGEQKPFDYESANIQQKDFAPKQEWSDEDEEMIEDLIKGCVSAEKAHHFVHTPKEVADWLKSLKNRMKG